MAAERTSPQVRKGGEVRVEALTSAWNHPVRETPITFVSAFFTRKGARAWLPSYP
ncbi:hypothetical protein [Streptomyces spongiae]|uniref:hypothetical protein n=1 Tax=Streptomyces spongiae TaxID=565072 RepID=UPI001883B701|nr:hypothetical protein [Streptomyces spongiae]